MLFPQNISRINRQWSGFKFTERAVFLPVRGNPSGSICMPVWPGGQLGPWLRGVWEECAYQCPALPILKFLINFEQEASHFPLPWSPQIALRCPGHQPDKRIWASLMIFPVRKLEWTCFSRVDSCSRAIPATWVQASLDGGPRMILSKPHRQGIQVTAVQPGAELCALGWEWKIKLFFFNSKVIRVENKIVSGNTMTL